MNAGETRATTQAAPGHFGSFGGRYVSETLIPPLVELEQCLAGLDEDFFELYRKELVSFAGRPTPLSHARRLSEYAGGARIYLKREDLNHTGSHKLNNAIGQALLAQRLGKTRLIAETGAGQHGVATAATAARYNLPCTVFMGEVDMERQSVNVFRMRLMGAEVSPVSSGSRTLKDALNEAMRDWVTRVDDTFYVIGSVAGPHPYPTMVRDFQAVIGREARQQMVELEGRLPDAIVACIGGGSNAIGIFHAFVPDSEVALYGVEAGGDGLASGRHAAPLSSGRPGVLHGSHSYLMMDDDGQILDTHSISAGLDYPGVGPEHSWLKESGRVTYSAATDKEALEAFSLLNRLEGIVPALESSHAIAHALDIARDLGSEGVLLINLSGRGDKDIDSVSRILAIK